MQLGIERTLKARFGDQLEKVVQVGQSYEGATIEVHLDLNLGIVGLIIIVCFF